jgi:hypothetical protein
MHVGTEVSRLHRTEVAAPNPAPTTSDHVLAIIVLGLQSSLVSDSRAPSSSFPFDSNSLGGLGPLIKDVFD